MRHVIAVLLFVLLVGVTTDLRAAKGTTHVWPVPAPALKKTKNPSGLTLRMDTRWVEGAGYRGVRFHVAQSNGAAAPADRTLRIEFRPRGARASNQSETTVGYLEFPQGATSASVWIPVRQSDTWSMVSVRTSEDGYLWEDLSGGVGAQGGGFAFNSNIQWTESFPCILFIDNDTPRVDASKSSYTLSEQPGLNSLPDPRLIGSLFPDNPHFGLLNVDRARLKPISDSKIVERFDTMMRYDLRHPDDLPDRWILYSCFDVIVISFPDARFLATNAPDKWTAILRQVGTGSALVVHGVGGGFGYLGELENLCRLPDAATNDESLADVELRWRDVAEMTPDQVFGVTDHGTFRAQWQQQRQQTAGMYEIDKEVVVDGSNVAQPSFDARWRNLQLGKLLAIDTDDPFSADKESWIRLFNTIGTNRWQWRARHGMSMTQPNTEFWNLMVPGVGMAPVASFLVLITVFAIFIGPVNYILLSRRKRLYLLLLTVPLGAAVVTFILFGYAVVNDGLGVRVRARSYTMLDQRNRQAVSWARQTYYAGLAPSSGLSFPLDTAVYPLHEAPPETSYNARPRYTTTWEDQQYLQGYFSSRSSSQFVSIHSGHTNHQLKVGAAAGAPSVTNLLGTDIELLVLCDEQGRLFRGGPIPRDQQSALTAIDAEKAESELRALSLASNPNYPEGYDRNVHRRSYNRRRYYGYYNQLEQIAGQPSTSTSILEDRLRAATSIVNQPLEKRSYLAVVGWSAEAPLGVRRVEEEKSFHVVRGKW